ncbi:hypothetical protein BD410DRAFT_835872 [Rickenella mellea]|uniref:Uncharacterized protein n=1 Tax=Rickenella mellea TaxID=50990 RepID=A0A4Y7QJ19_9AGAM|nr:hypothetical protein BD410DRAFT_835872 [Rickenella mellea]
MSRLLTILSSCPRLKELTLIGAGPTYVDGEEPTDCLDVSLSHLQTLVLTANVAICSKLLSHLSFPADLNCEIDCDIGPGQELTTFTLPISTKCKSLVVVMYSLCLEMSAYDVRPSTINPKTGRKAQFRVNWGRASPQPSWVDVFEFAVNLTGRRNITDLRFHPYHAIPEYPSPTAIKLWRRFFCCLPNLRTLKFHNAFEVNSTKTEVSIAQVLGTPYDKLTSKGGLVCPNLRNVEFSDFNLCVGRGNALEELKEFLAFRKLNHARLTTLTLTDCNGLDSDEVALLEPLVGSVVWDYVVRDDESEYEEEEPDEYDDYGDYEDYEYLDEDWEDDYFSSLWGI